MAVCHHDHCVGYVIINVMVLTAFNINRKGGLYYMTGKISMTIAYLLN